MLCPVAFESFASAMHTRRRWMRQGRRTAGYKCRDCGSFHLVDPADVPAYARRSASQRQRGYLNRSRRSPRDGRSTPGTTGHKRG
jgi:hypothetical protein